MATSTVILYKTQWKAEQNAIVEQLSNLLTSGEFENEAFAIRTYTEFQYIKHGLDIQIKLPLSQTYNANLNFNYVSIKNSDDTRTYYYYVTDTSWKSETTLQVNLSQDTLNTWNDLLVFTDRTQIQRQHKDRFVEHHSAGSFTATRIIDKVDEGLNGLQKFKESHSGIATGDQKWYLVYCTADGSNVANYSSNSAIDCYLVPENDTTFSVSGNNYTIADLGWGTDTQRIFTSSGVSFDINGTTYTNSSTDKYAISCTGSTPSYSLKKLVISGSTMTWNNVTNLSGTDDIVFSDTMQATFLVDPSVVYGLTDAERYNFYMALDKSATTYYSDATLVAASIKSIDRTLSYLVKIIECPYAPVQFTITNDVYTIPLDFTLGRTTVLSSNGMYALKLNTLSKEFSNSIASYTLSDLKVTIPASRLATLKNATYESKLYNSSFYNLNFAYDSFIKPINYENLDGTDGTTPYVNIWYKQSNTINSNLLYWFSPVNLTWNKTDNYEDYLVATRNNEMPIYNSSYINYMRNGYNYDKKAKSEQLHQGVTQTIISTVGTVGSLAAGIATGNPVGFAAAISLATSTIASASSIYYNQVNAQNNIDQKIAEAKATAVSVAGSDDINLFNYYAGNKLSVYKYQVSSEMRDRLFELFYRTGYASNEIGKPVTDSRVWFNYLQCIPDFDLGDGYDTQYSALMPYLDDIKSRFQLGVTYFHRHSTSYSMDFTHENWESWMV